MIKGITIQLKVKTASGTDAFNHTTYTSEWVNVDNVLVAPISDQELLSNSNLVGKKGLYTLGIPKGDTHQWENTEVEFFGRRFRTIGEPLEGIEELIPLSWNKKVRVESVVQD